MPFFQNSSNNESQQEIPAVVHVSESVPLSKSQNLAIDIATWNGMVFLRMYRAAYSERYTGAIKGTFVAIKAETVQEFVSIIRSIPPDCELREYGSAGKYKIYVSTYEGSTNFQIREWVETKKFAWFTRHGISVSIEKFSEFRSVLEKVVSKLEAVVRGEFSPNHADATESDRSAFF